MQSLTRFQRTVFSLLLLVCFLYSGYLFLATRPTAHTTRERQEEILPPEGKIENDTKGLVPGNPENGRKRLRYLHELLTHYQRKHGVMSVRFGDMWSDMVSNPKDYGLNSFDELFTTVLKNPDSQYDDNKLMRGLNVFVTDDKRADGAPKFSTNEREVITYTTTYYHQNARQYPGQRTTTNPVGFYQVLWSDGTVEDVPYDKALYVPTERKGYLRLTFPGETGIPDNAKTYDEYHGGKGPRGGPGKEGLDYAGNPIYP